MRRVSIGDCARMVFYSNAIEWSNRRYCRGRGCSRLGRFLFRLRPLFRSIHLSNGRLFGDATHAQVLAWQIVSIFSCVPCNARTFGYGRTTHNVSIMTAVRFLSRVCEQCALSASTNHLPLAADVIMTQSVSSMCADSQSEGAVGDDIEMHQDAKQLNCNEQKGEADEHLGGKLSRVDNISTGERKTRKRQCTQVPTQQRTQMSLSSSPQPKAAAKRRRVVSHTPGHGSGSGTHIVTALTSSQASVAVPTLVLRACCETCETFFEDVPISKANPRLCLPCFELEVLLFFRCTMWLSPHCTLYHLNASRFSYHVEQAARRQKVKTELIKMHSESLMQKKHNRTKPRRFACLARIASM